MTAENAGYGSALELLHLRLPYGQPFLTHIQKERGGGIEKDRGEREKEEQLEREGQKYITHGTLLSIQICQKVFISRH